MFFKQHIVIRNIYEYINQKAVDSVIWPFFCDFPILPLLLLMLKTHIDAIELKMIFNY